MANAEFIKYNSQTSELEVQIANEDYQDIVINKELVLHVSKSADGGYIVDLYRNSKLSEEYMYEEDFITSVVAYYDDLRRDITVDSNTKDEETSCNEDFYLLGSKLFCDEEQIGEDFDEDQIAQAILDRVSNRINFIEIDGEKIYEG